VTRANINAYRTVAEGVWDEGEKKGEMKAAATASNLEFTLTTLHLDTIDSRAKRIEKEATMAARIKRLTTWTEVEKKTRTSHSIPLQPLERPLLPLPASDNRLTSNMTVAIHIYMYLYNDTHSYAMSSSGETTESIQVFSFSF